MEQQNTSRFCWICCVFISIWFSLGCQGTNKDNTLSSGIEISVPDETIVYSPDKKSIPENEPPIYLLSYYYNDGADWLGYFPQILGSSLQSETMYMRTFDGKLTFLDGLLPNISIQTDAPALYEDDLMYGQQNTLYVTSQNNLSKENDFVTQIKDKEVVAQIPMPFSRLGEIYYDPSTKLWYAYGTNGKNKERDQIISYVAIYKDTELLKLWDFPGVTFDLWPVGDGRGYIYFRLVTETRNETYEQISDKYSYSYETITIRATDEPNVLFTDTERFRGFQTDAINKYVYLLNRYDREQPDKLGLFYDGQVVWHDNVPKNIFSMFGTPNPITGKVYGASPVRANGAEDNYQEKLYGQYPVFSIENQQPIFHDYLRLDLEEPYPDSLLYTFDYSTSTMYGLDKENGWVYVIYDTQLVHRFPFSCNQPQGIHVNSITSLIYINCLGEVQVFAYPSLISLETQKQIEELRKTTPDFFKYADTGK